jgi:hypothetical protein
MHILYYATNIFEVSSAAKSAGKLHYVCVSIFINAFGNKQMGIAVNADDKGGRDTESSKHRADLIK